VTQRHIAAEENPHTSTIFMVMPCALPKDSADSLKVQSSGTIHSEDIENKFKKKTGFNLQTDFNLHILMAEFCFKGTKLDYVVTPEGKFMVRTKINVDNNIL